MEKGKWKYSSLHVYSCHRSKQGLVQRTALSEHVVFASPDVDEAPSAAVKSSLQWANRNWLVLRFRVDSSCLLPAFRNWNCWIICFLTPAESDRHPYAKSEGPCTFVTVNLPHKSASLHLHSLLYWPSSCIFCSLIHFELSKKSNHLCWNFPCFISDQRWI